MSAKFPRGGGGRTFFSSNAICISSDTLQVGERLKLYKEENYVIKSNEKPGLMYLDIL